jgi:hypothetical protein
MGNLRGELRQAIKAITPNEDVRDFSNHSELIAVMAPPLVGTEEIIALTGLHRMEPVHVPLPDETEDLPSATAAKIENITEEVRAGKFLYGSLQTDSFWGIRPTPDMVKQGHQRYIIPTSLPDYRGLRNNASRDDVRGVYVVANAWEIWQKNIIAQNIPEADSLIRKALEERSLYFILETEPPDEAAADLRLFAEHHSANHDSRKEGMARDAARRLLNGLLPRLRPEVFENSRAANPRVG